MTNTIGQFRYEAAMIPFLLILAVLLFFRHATKAEVNRRFRVLTLSTLVAASLSVAAVVFEGRLSPFAYALLTTCVYISANANAYALLSYVAAYVEFRNQSVLRAFHILLYIGTGLLALNLFTGFAFTVDASGCLVRGPFYLLTRSVFIFLFAGAAFALQNVYQQFYENAQFILMNFLLFLLIDAFVVQYLFVSSLQIVYVVATAILFSTFFYLEAPTFRGIAQTEEELNAVMTKAQTSADRARSASRAKSDFLANTSHEIRTPMNAILGMNEMIRKESTDEEVLNASYDIKRAGEALLTIINNILDISKFDAGRMEPFPVEFFVSELIDDVEAAFRERIEEKGLTFSVEVNKEIKEHLYGDAESIRRVLSNLLDNAVKYTENGSITLHVLGGGLLQEGDEEYRSDLSHLTQAHLQFLVEDTGIGMREEEMEELFEAFERVNLKETQNIQGAGLGLTLVRYMVQMMNGRIRAESVYGEGSAFTVDLPIGIMEEGFTGTIAEYEAEHAAAGKRDLTGKRVLIVDDTEVNLVVAEGTLSGLGAVTETASSGEECLEQLKENEYDIVFLDHKMPGMDGVETLTRARAMFSEDESRKAEAPLFIALTANTGAGLREEYKNLGFDDYLSKPMSEADILRVVG